MKELLNVKGKSQYDSDIDAKYRSSACGPTTAYVLLNFICKDQELSNKSVNELYKYLGSTKIGLFKWRMRRNLQRLLGNDWLVAECSLSEALNEIRHGRPVALKFDKYFTFNWFKKPLFKYHWVPLIGYEARAGKLYLIIHDNGGRNRKSQVREFLYEENRDVMSFIKITPNIF